jgi:hypothetical protein
MGSRSRYAGWILGLPWGLPGTILGSYLGHPGTILGLGPSWEHPWAILGSSWGLPETILEPSGTILGVWSCCVDPGWYPGWTQVRLAAPGARFPVSRVDPGADSGALVYTGYTLRRLQGDSGALGSTRRTFPHPGERRGGPEGSSGTPCGYSVGPFFTTIRTL